MNIIGDVAGEFDTLMLLVDKMPEEEIILLGDLNDRGNDTPKVIQWCIDNNIRTIQSNHGHMMIDWYRNGKYYEDGIWAYNGGEATFRSYNYSVPETHIQYLEQCPMYIIHENYILSHAPLRKGYTLEELCDLGVSVNEMKCDISLLWNRYVDKYKDGVINIFGHNSSDKVKIFNSTYPDGIKMPEGEVSLSDAFAVCLDSSSGKKLSGINLNNSTIYEQEYI